MGNKTIKAASSTHLKRTFTGYHSWIHRMQPNTLNTENADCSFWLVLTPSTLPLHPLFSIPSPLPPPLYLLLLYTACTFLAYADVEMAQLVQCAVRSGASTRCERVGRRWLTGRPSGLDRSTTGRRSRNHIVCPSIRPDVDSS